MWRRRRCSRGAWLSPPRPRWLRLWLPWLLLLWAPGADASSNDFCYKLLRPDTGDLHWARRSNEDDTKKEGQPVMLNCCARNYDEIRWFRVNESNQEWLRLPNNMASSLVHLYDSNRTLMTGLTGAQSRDTGQYVCQALNLSEGASINHTIFLSIRVYDVEGTVLEVPFEEHTLRLEDSAYFTCSIISDSNSGVWLHQYGDNGTFANYDEDGNLLPNVEVLPIHTMKDLKHVSGQSVNISAMQPKNFGTYHCFLNKKIMRTVILKEGGYQRELKATVMCLITLFILIAVLGPFCWYWHIELRLFWKDRFGKLEENDDKVYDIFLSYDAEDAPFVLGTLVPVLEDHFRYRCFAWERDSIAGDWIPETLVQSIRDSRRFLMILSPALLENRWCTFALHIALKAVLQLQLHIICIKLHDVDWRQVQLADKSANETIRQVLHVVRTVVWEPSKGKSRKLSNQQIVAVKDKNLLSFNKFIKRKNDMPDEDIKAPGRSCFWRKLRLYLPPRRTLPLLSKPPASPTSTKSLLSLPHGSDCC